METERLLLRKARPEDRASIYRNLWSRPESFRYTFWQPSPDEASSYDRILRTIAFQESRDSYFVVEKKTGEVIGFAGVSRVENGLWEEEGICLGPDYTGRGFGTEILAALTEYARTRGAKEFLYRAREENVPSRRLALSSGFTEIGREEVTDGSGLPVTLIVFSKTL